MTRRRFAKLVLDDLTHRAYVRLIAEQHGVSVPWMRPLADDQRRFARAFRWYADSFLRGAR